jgi:hypothetical protein
MIRVESKNVVTHDTTCSRTQRSVTRVFTVRPSNRNHLHRFNKEVIHSFLIPIILRVWPKRDSDMKRSETADAIE